MNYLISKKAISATFEWLNFKEEENEDERKWMKTKMKKILKRLLTITETIIQE